MLQAKKTTPKPGHGRKAKLGRAGILCGVAAALTLLLQATPAGFYLEKHLYISPSFRLQKALGWQPRLHRDVRAIMVDDGSLRHLGRTPTFAEWAQLADMLFAMGYEKVLLQEPQDLAEQIGSPNKRHGHGTMIAAVLDVGDSKSLRAVATASLPAHFGLEVKDPGLCHDSLDSRMVLAPGQTVLSHIDALGMVNVDLDTSFRVPVGLCAADGRFFPYLGLYASTDLRLTAQGLFIDKQKMPRSADGDLWVNFIDLASVVEKAIPIKSFYDQEGKLRTSLQGTTLARLQGGRIAVLLPGAYTGSRYTSSPADGLLPAYMTLLSVITSALEGRFFVLALPPLWVTAASGLVISMALALFSSVSLALSTALTLGLSFVCASIAVFLAFGWVLPTASVSILCTALAGLRFAEHFRQSMHDKGRMELELEVGQTVQRTLLPHKLEGILGAWAYRITYRPHGAMAGDWFQIYQRQDGFAVIAVGDVVGKGASAALVTATIASVWQAEARRWDAFDFDPLRLLDTLNTAIKDVYRGEQNTTLSLAVLWPDKIQVFGVSAPSWIQLRPRTKGNTLTLRQDSPIGLTPVEWRWPSKEITPKEGEIFMAYTDGVLDDPRAIRQLCQDAKLFDYDDTDSAFGAVLQVCSLATLGNSTPDDFTLCLIQRLPNNSELVVGQEPKISA